MNILVSVDSFKGSLESIEAGEIIREGILNVVEDAKVIVKPLADGGEGTVSALTTGLGGQFVDIEVEGPLKAKVTSRYGIVEGRAIMEMASSSGLTLLEKKDRNPLNTSTFGLGEMIKDALDKGYRDFIIGIGGSATNDLGIGMLKSLGYRFLGEDNRELEARGKDLSKIVKIDDSQVDRRLKDCVFEIACDVDNPLYGENGASYVYGPQKGASPDIVEELDMGARKFSDLVGKKYGLHYENVEGVGAAGGLGYAFKTFLGGELLKGIDIIINFLEIEEDMKKVDLAITGEGEIDYQTMMGKAPSGIAKLGAKYKVPVIALAGSLGRDVEKINQLGIDGYFSITPGPMSLEDAMDREASKKNLRRTVEQIMRIYRLGGN